MPRPRLTDEEREVSQARRRQLDAARKRRRRMDASYRQIEQQANTEARRKAREISRTLCREVNGRSYLQTDVPTIFPECILSQWSVTRMGNNQQTLIGSTRDFFPLANHSIFGECSSGTASMYVVNDHNDSLQSSCKLVPKLRKTDKKICESDVHKQDGDRVSTVNTDCSNSKPESTPSMEDNKCEKKRELATARPDASVYFKEMSARNNLGMVKLEPDSDKEAHAVPIITESEFIDIKQEETPVFQSLEKDVDGDNGVDVTSSLRKGGGEDVSHMDNFPT